jgi:hypothetical protein
MAKLIAALGQEVVNRSARARGPTRIPSDSFQNLLLERDAFRVILLERGFSGVP